MNRAWAFFDAAARHEDTMLGWRVGRFVGDHNLNRGLRSRVEHAPTLYRALKFFLRLAGSEASHVKLGLVERRDDIVLYTDYPIMKGVPGYSSSQAYQIGILIDVVRSYAGEDWMPEEIGIEDPVAPSIAREIYPSSRILPCQRFGYITIPRSYLYLARPDRVEEVDAMGSALKTRRLDYVGTLRSLLDSYLSGGGVSEELAAELMGTSTRTLKRRLSESGTTYIALVDELRFKKAKELLTSSSARIIEIAGAVGFNDSSHFARMFRRVGGISPREFRRVTQRRQT